VLQFRYNITLASSLKTTVVKNVGGDSVFAYLAFLGDMIGNIAL